MISKQQIERLEEIQAELKELAEEAMQIVRWNCNEEHRCSILHERAKAYWYPQLVMSLGDDHNYMESSMCSLQDTIKDMYGCIEEDENEIIDNEEDEEDENDEEEELA